MNLEFAPIELSQQNAYQDYLSQCPQVTSDYSFINLWGWGPVYGLEWAWAESLVWIRQNRPKTIYWAPMGDWRGVQWQKIVETYADFRTEFARVPEMLTGIWEQAFKDRITIYDDRDQWDYVHGAKELIELAGNRFHKKKNHVYQFKKSYTYQYAAMTPGMVSKAMAMQENWCTWRECSSDIQLAHENEAIARVLSKWENLSGVLGGCIIADDRVVAYTVGERLTPEMMVIHFEKGDAEYKGIYQAINQMFLEDQASAMTWVNREQDTGDGGLRKAKMSYHPARFLKKYRVSFGDIK